MAGQYWRMAALSGEAREVQVLGSRGGGAWALPGSSVASPSSLAVTSRSSSELGGLEAHGVRQSHGAPELGFPLSRGGRGAIRLQADGRPGGARWLLPSFILLSVTC